MIKKIISTVVIILLFLVSHSYAQQKVIRHCDLLFVYKMHWDKNMPEGKISIDAGTVETQTPFKDSTILVNIKKVEKFKTLSGALNYLGDLGWKNDAIIHLPGPGAEAVRVILSKEFDAIAVNQFSSSK